MDLAKNTRAIAVAIIVVIVLGFASYTFLSTPGQVAGRIPQGFTVDGRTFTFAYVAADQASRETGLMNRKVTNTTTMLFAFPSPGTYRFWMYHTNTSLDLIWVMSDGGTGRVVFVVSGAQPCPALPCPDYGPTSPANYVIEAKAGFAESSGIQAGTEIDFV